MGALCTAGACGSSAAHRPGECPLSTGIHAIWCIMTPTQREPAPHACAPVLVSAGQLARVDMHGAAYFILLSAQDDAASITLPSQPLSAADDALLAVGSTITLPCAFVASRRSCASIGKGRVQSTARAPVP